jgi:hypothetical protein
MRTAKIFHDCGCHRSGSDELFTQASGVNVYTNDTLLPFSQYKLGMTLSVMFKNSNTVPSTININGMGNIALKKNGGSSQLDSGDIIAGGIYELQYDGNSFQIIINTAI